MDFLNSKQRKEFYKQLKEQYNYQGPKQLALFRTGNDKIYAIHPDIDSIAFTQMRTVQAGLYVASTQSNDLRLTLDGAILFGEHCKNCFVDLTLEQKNAWMAGENIAYDGPLHGYIILRHDKRIIGCGSVSNNGFIKNYVPKGRRISDPHTQPLP